VTGSRREAQRAAASLGQALSSRDLGRADELLSDDLALDGVGSLADLFGPGRDSSRLLELERRDGWWAVDYELGADLCSIRFELSEEAPSRIERLRVDHLGPPGWSWAAIEAPLRSLDHPEPVLPARVALAVHERLATVVDARRLVGLAAAVTHAGQVAHTSRFGVAACQGFVPLEPLTRWRAGSLTKVLTALVALDLTDKGILDLDQPIADGLPETTFVGIEGPPPPRVRELLSHTAGVGPSHPSWHAPGVEPHRGGVITATDAAGRHLYSNLGYDLLAEIMEAATGRTYDELISALLARLGMRHSTVDVDPPPTPSIAVGHQRSGDWVAPAPATRVASAAAGGLVTTIDDLAQLSTQLSRPGSALLAATRTHRVPVPSGHQSVGITISRPRHDEILWHAGAVPGTTSWIGSIPAAELSLVLLTNMTTAPLTEDGFDLLNLAAENL
jgi:CubicO group peptidase (beta-lactamase class C family)